MNAQDQEINRLSDDELDAVAGGFTTITLSNVFVSGHSLGGDHDPVPAPPPSR
jgi:hypothetical protein